MEQAFYLSGEMEYMFRNHVCVAVAVRYHSTAWQHGERTMNKHSDPVDNPVRNYYARVCRG